jgi:hypothetical protein
MGGPVLDQHYHVGLTGERINFLIRACGWHVGGAGMATKLAALYHSYHC